MTSLYTKIAANVLFPLHERMKRHASVKVKNGLEQSQWYDKDQLEKLQLQRLRSLLISAKQHVPYYRSLFEGIEFDPDQLTSLEDIRNIPFLDKETIRTNSDDLMADTAIGLSRFNTGGSSGEPLVFYISKERVSHDVAAKWRATRWWGVDIGDPEIVLWGSPIELGNQDRTRMLRDKLLRTHLVPAFEMNEAMVQTILTKIKAFRPKMLFGYPSAFAHIAAYARAHDMDMQGLGIKVVFVTSERLYDEQRQLIESVFSCPVANGYGGRDAGFIAHECTNGSMHITAEDIVVEIVDEKGHVLPPGQPGEIVVTHLATGAYPFIRYRTGDIAVLDDKKCSCGRGLPLLKEIQGRTTDFMVASDGTVMHGLALIYIVRDRDGVRKFKIIQRDLYNTSILLVTDENFDSVDIAKIEAEGRQRLGQDVKVKVEIVADIPAEKSGKYRYVVSHVSSR